MNIKIVEAVVNNSMGATNVRFEENNLYISLSDGCEVSVAIVRLGFILCFSL